MSRQAKSRQLRERVRLRVTRDAPGLVGLRWMVSEPFRGSSWLAADDGPEAERLQAELGDRVHAGPFAGLSLPVDAVCSERWPKLAGTYEQELAPAIEACLAREYPVVVNVGAAEGYYAVGFARGGARRVVAVDPLARARRRVKEVAAANGVAERVDVRAIATRRRLSRWLADGGLVLMDCEGAEYGLLDPQRCPGLRAADVLVEVHEFAVDGLGAELAERFAPTHEITWIEQQPRHPEREPALAGLAPDLAAAAVREQRPGRLHWALFSAT
jgi:hypothetical protein